MTSQPFTIRPEMPDDSAAIDHLNDVAFGPGRFARAAYRIREGRAHEPGLSFVGEVDGTLIGSVRLTRIAVCAEDGSERDGLLLGPLVVDPKWKDRGCGKQLVRTAVTAARDAGHRLVILVGDAPYYGPLGFKPLPPYQLRLPGPVDPARLLVAELAEGAADGLAGLVRAAAD